MVLEFMHTLVSGQDVDKSFMRMQFFLRFAPVPGLKSVCFRLFKKRLLI